MRPSSKYIVLIALALAVAACEDGPEKDSVPPAFAEIFLSPDEVYMYPGGELGVRLDPLLNDTIKAEVTVSYETPDFGKISFIPNEGWFYKPDEGFTGVDSFNYTVCHESQCKEALITMHVEAPLDPNTCVWSVNGESVQTTKDKPIEIRIFANDTVCQYMGSGVSSPEKGTFQSYSYSGTIKNIVYVYYPPKGFVGTDRFSYKLFTPQGDVQVYCNITITN